MTFRTTEADPFEDRKKHALWAQFLWISTFMLVGALLNIFVLSGGAPFMPFSMAISAFICGQLIMHLGGKRPERTIAILALLIAFASVSGGLAIGCGGASAQQCIDRIDAHIASLPQ